ncbi:hypothetical protein Bhyg_02472 [Pseudolycoriella hygida]|uniref:Uncharacterized protein n=1 Tax=Pseudolycoriella hygida TaxID=35572 RepID=A0A9Q0ND00_9DIPT|nr:hypothetical protein Bhyg_02472 [Pseudolycoriella hygida]
MKEIEVKCKIVVSYKLSSCIITFVCILSRKQEKSPKYPPELQQPFIEVFLAHSVSFSPLNGKHEIEVKCKIVVSYKLSSCIITFVCILSRKQEKSPKYPPELQQPFIEVFLAHSVSFSPLNGKHCKNKSLTKCYTCYIPHTTTKKTIANIPVKFIVGTNFTNEFEMNLKLEKLILRANDLNLVIMVDNLRIRGAVETSPHYEDILPYTLSSCETNKNFPRKEMCHFLWNNIS